MELIVLGTSHRVASVGVRERLHIELDAVYDALAPLLADDGPLQEALPLATCGRFEMYAVTDHPEAAHRALCTLVAAETGVEEEELKAHSYLHRGAAAARQLFRVASGLDSVVHGEAQILGQVRDALHHPRTRDAAGTVLLRLFQNALATGKRVRTETEIGRGAASLAGAALTLLDRELGSMAWVTALILGAGDTGTLVARLLRKKGVGRIIIANRTESRAVALAEAVDGEAASLSDLESLLPQADLVVGAVANQSRFIEPAQVESLPPAASGRPRYFLDLSHPRNFDPMLDEVEGARVFDLEHIASRVAEAREARRAQIPKAEAIVDEETTEFERWLRTRESVGVLKAVREHVLARAGEEADRLARGRSPEEREEITRIARSLARSLLYAPTVALREADPASQEGRWLLDSATSLFGIDASIAGNGESR